jgi:hypothetical protein
MEDKIKKIKDRIYEIDFSTAALISGEELIVRNNVSEFVMALRKRDLDKGIIVTPAGYRSGLVYKSTNGGELYNHPSWIPDIISFSLNIFGLKKGHFYKITVIGRDTGTNSVITNDRSLRVSTEDKELLIDADLRGMTDNNREFYGIFRTPDNEANLFFSIGKIYLTNIIIDEIEILTDESDDEEETIKGTIEDGKLQLVSYGIFTTQPVNNTDYKGRYVQMTRYTGRGINLYFDKNTNQYILERDNANDILGEAFTNLNYIVDFNFNKVPNKGLFSQYNICEVSTDISPNTLKQGFLKFEFADSDDRPVLYTNTDGRMAILIYKIF